MKEFNEFGPFAVGEICVIVSGRRPDLIGTEVTIMANQTWVTDRISGRVIFAYETNLVVGGVSIYARESTLRRRKPPATDKGEQALNSLIREWSAAPALPVVEERRESVSAHMVAYDNLRAAIAVDGMVQRIEREIARSAQ